jgi:hypothetical protein
MFATVNPSLMHFTQHIQVPMNPICAKTLQLTTMWSHMATMALSGLKCLSQGIVPLPGGLLVSFDYAVQFWTKYILIQDHCIKCHNEDKLSYCDCTP